MLLVFVCLCVYLCDLMLGAILLVLKDEGGVTFARMIKDYEQGVNVDLVGIRLM